MDFEWAEDEAAFQGEVRAFISENRSPDVMDITREGMAQLVDSPERRDFMGKLGGK